MSSSLVFRAANAPWSVWTCACGCDEFVRMTNQREIDCQYDERYYVASHAPLGASIERKGVRYTLDTENATTSPPEALPNEFNEDTPTDPYWMNNKPIDKRHLKDKDLDDWLREWEREEIIQEFNCDDITPVGR